MGVDWSGQHSNSLWHDQMHSNFLPGMQSWNPVPWIQSPLIKEWRKQCTYYSEAVDISAQTSPHTQPKPKSQGQLVGSSLTPVHLSLMGRQPMHWHRPLLVLFTISYILFIMTSGHFRVCWGAKLSRWTWKQTSANKAPTSLIHGHPSWAIPSYHWLQACVTCVTIWIPDQISITVTSSYSTCIWHLLHRIQLIWYCTSILTQTIIWFRCFCIHWSALQCAQQWTKRSICLCTPNFSHTTTTTLAMEKHEHLETHDMDADRKQTEIWGWDYSPCRDSAVQWLWLLWPAGVQCIERWWSAQGRSSLKEERRRAVGNLSSLASYYILVCTCSVTTRYQ